MRDAASLQDGTKADRQRNACLRRLSTMLQATEHITLTLPEAVAHKLTAVVKRLVATGMDEDTAFSELLTFALDETAPKGV